MERQKRNYGENKPERGRSPYKKREGFASRDSEQRNDSSSRRPRIEKEGKVERPQRNFSSDNSRRSYNENRSDERPRRSFDNNRSEDRPRRSFDNNRSEDRPKRDFGSSRVELRPRKSFDSKRPRLKKDDDFFQISGNSKGYSEVLTSKDGLIRLNKYISNSGICSRREADELIQAGTVTVNGEVVTKLGTTVKPGDVIQSFNWWCCCVWWREIG